MRLRWGRRVGHVEGYDLNYHFHAVGVHGATCKRPRHAIAGYLHGRGHHLGGDHPSTELSVEGWDVLLVDHHASGQHGFNSFRARYT